MTDDRADASPLDNPMWSALTGPLAHLALTVGRARRLPPDMSPFAALPADADKAAWDDLAELLGPGGLLVTAAPPLPVPSGWTVELELPGVQMVAGPRDDAPVPAAPPVGTAVALGTADVPEMISLVARTEPGPFELRTIEFGGYVGVRLDGELVAMAGRRLRVPGFTEVSAVCTLPEVRGRGLAGWLTRTVVAGIRAEGDRPFLHALESNTGAIRLYEALGFELRRRIPFAVLGAPGGPPVTP